jgi:hypothetical protein
MEIVNGIPCFNCTDVEKAKKVGTNGPDIQDPLHPSTKITNPQIANLKTANLKTANLKTDSVNGINASDASGPGYSNSEQLGVNQPLASGDRGTKINIAT